MSEIKVNKKVLKQSQGIWKMRKDEAGKKGANTLPSKKQKPGRAGS